MAVVSENTFYVKMRNDNQVGILSALGFAILTGLGGLLVIPLPFTPVPITAQTFFVLLSGIFLGRKFGPISQIMYISIGVMGIPWFANQQSGIGVLLGATGGYLVGFVLCSFLIGFILDISGETRRLSVIIYSLTLSTLIIYISGILGLIFIANFGFITALNLGFFPFLPGDLFKIFISILIANWYLPKESTNIDTGFTRASKIAFLVLTLIISISLVFFIVYMITAGTLPPDNLRMYSIFASLIVVPGIVFGYIIKEN